MAYGINVSRDGTIRASTIRAIYPEGSWVRVVLTLEYDLTNYFQELLGVGLKILGVIASESFIQGDGSRISIDEAAGVYTERYGYFLDALQLGNEWDHVSDSSWTLDIQTLNRLLKAFYDSRESNNRKYLLILGGAVSGNPDALKGIELKYVDAIAVHPYGKSPSNNWPYPGWYFGFYEPLIELYRNYGKPVWITEVGWSSLEPGSSEEFKAEYLRRWLLAWKYVPEPLIFFCGQDYNGFGIFGFPSEQVIKEFFMPEYYYIYGIKTKADELGSSIVGDPLENEHDADFCGHPIRHQSSTNGYFIYWKEYNRTDFFKQR